MWKHLFLSLPYGYNLAFKWNSKDLGHCFSLQQVASVEDGLFRNIRGCKTTPISKIWILVMFSKCLELPDSPSVFKFKSGTNYYRAAKMYRDVQTKRMLVCTTRTHTKNVRAIIQFEEYRKSWLIFEAEIRLQWMAWRMLLHTHSSWMSLSLRTIICENRYKFWRRIKLIQIDN